MARLSSKPYPGDWGMTNDMNADFERCDAQLRAIDEAQPDPAAKSLVGARLDFPRGDGVATYVVVKDKPLTLAHVPHGDAWRADDCTIRGVDADYVRRWLVRAQSRRQLFGGDHG